MLVPQGSHQGPLSFNFSINSLPQVPKNCDLTLFADDCNMICVSPPGTTLDGHMAVLQQDLENCIDWAPNTASVFIASKCLYMTFRRPQASPVTEVVASLNMTGQSLEQVSTHQHLGIGLSSSLDLSSHIQNITQRFRAQSADRPVCRRDKVCRLDGT